MSLGFTIHKCRTGWMFMRDDKNYTMEHFARMRAYKSLGSLLWHLAKRVKEIENADRDERSGTGAGPQEGRAEAQPPATGASVGKAAPSEVDSRPAAAA